MPLVSTFGTAAVTLTGTTETVVASSPAFTYVPGGTYAGMAVRGVVNFTAGTNVTQVTARVRAGTAITSTLVGGAGVSLQVQTSGTANTYEFPFEVVDTSVNPASQYSICLLQTAPATAANGQSLTYEIELDPVIP